MLFRKHPSSARLPSFVRADEFSGRCSGLGKLQRFQTESSVGALCRFKSLANEAAILVNMEIYGLPFENVTALVYSQSSSSTRPTAGLVLTIPGR